jgi:hypothetical protein
MGGEEVVVMGGDDPVEEQLDELDDDKRGKAERKWYNDAPKGCPLNTRPRLVPIVVRTANDQGSGGRPSAMRYGADGELKVREIGRVNEGTLTVAQQWYANMEAEMCVWRATYTFGYGCPCFGSRDITVIQIKEEDVPEEIWNNWLRLADAVSLPCDVMFTSHATAQRCAALMSQKSVQSYLPLTLDAGCPQYETAASETRFWNKYPVRGKRGKSVYFNYKQDNRFTERFSIAFQKDKDGVVKVVLQVRCCAVLA